VELLAELAVQMLGIGEADSEGDEGADVAEDGIAHGGRELRDVLMTQREIEPVFAGFGEDAREGLGGEVLKLIDEQVEVASLGLRLSAAGHRGELELRDEQGAEQVRFVVTDLALGEVGYEDALVVHHERDAHLAAHLADDVADDGGEQELTHLVLYRRDGLAFESLIIALELIDPVVLQERIAHLAHDPMPVSVIGEHAVDAEQGSVLALCERGHGVVQDELQSRPPGVVPDVLERSDDAGRDEMPVVVVRL